MIDPFQGFRPTPSAGSLADVVSPPYDKIKDDLLQTLRQRSPSNAVHLIRGESGPSDDTWHPQAARHMADWIEKGLLARDERPAWYVMKQTFTLPDGTCRERCAVVGALDLAQQQRVRHHERTHTRAKVDRLALLRATGTHFGQIFLLRKGAPALGAAELQGREVGAVTVEPGVETRFLVVDDEATVERLRGLMADADYVIADGHHRFTTACTYHDETPAADRVMVSVVDLEDPGLAVLPTHRLVRGLPAERMDAAVRALGATEELEAGTDILESLRDLAPGAMLLVTADGRPRRWETGTSASAGASGLDVAVLEKRLLDPLLQGLDVEDHLSYHRDPKPALESLKRGPGCLLALVAPIPPHVVVDIALSGDVMPQKSTDFFPKIPTGLVYLATPAAPILE